MLWSRSLSESGVFGSLEPEPLEERKTGAGAAWKKSHEPEPLKKLAGSSALLEDKKHKEIVFCYSSLGKIVSFYG